MRIDTCSICIFKRRKRARIANSQPILTQNFSTRGKIDLIDYSDAPDRPHKCLLCHYYHGIKIVNYRLLTNKHLMVVACSSLSMFRVAGPLDALQSDNAGEFASTT